MAFTDTLSGPVDETLSGRPSASIVILAWNQWPMTEACLRTLRPTLGIYDEVIVVDNGSVDATPDALALYPWVKVVTNSSNRGFAAGCNDGAAIATRDVVVFLNNDTLLVGRWLDELLLPFVDPAVGATGPRSNFVSGPQMVLEADYFQHGETGLRGFVQRWQESQPTAVQPLHRLVGFCLAVRRTALEQVGGFDEAFGTGGFEDDDLCRRLVGDRWQLLMANRSFVHHHGHATFDGNGLDWQAIEAQNRAIFEAKHGSLVPAPAEVAGPSELNIPLDPGVALVVDHLDAEAVLGARGWTTMSRPRGCDLVTELDACDPRPSLVVVHGHDTMVDRLDVPVIVVGEPVTGGSADAYGDPTRPANDWLPGLLDMLRSTQTFGGLLLRCRLSLDADDLATAFEAVRVAEGMRPGTPQASNAMAVCAFSGGHYEEALALLNRAIEIDPSFGPAKDNLAALGI